MAFPVSSNRPSGGGHWRERGGERQQVVDEGRQGQGHVSHMTECMGRETDTGEDTLIRAAEESS